MKNHLAENIKKNDKEKISFAIREMVKQNIKYQSDTLVSEAVSYQAGSVYSSEKSGMFGIIGASLSVAATYIYASSLPFIVAGTLGTATFVTGGTALLLFGAGVVGFMIGADIGNMVSTDQLIFSKKARSNAMDAEISRIFSQLTSIAKERDRLIAKVIKASPEDESKVLDRYGDKLANLTKTMKTFSENLESEIQYAGNDTDMTPEERNELMNIVESGKKGLISDVLTNRSAMTQLKRKVEMNDKRVAA